MTGKVNEISNTGCVLRSIGVTKSYDQGAIFLQVDLTKIETPNFTAGAKEAAEAKITAYASALVKEAIRFEEASNSGGQADVTASMVEDANSVVRRGLRNGQSKILNKIVRALAPIVALIVGFVFRVSDTTDTSDMLLVLFLFGVAVALSILSVVTE